MSRFTDAFARANRVAGDIMGEPFTVNGVDYMALDIGELSQSERLTLGGKYRPGTLKITLTETVLAACGLTFNKKLMARGASLRVDDIAREGDDSPILTCGPDGAAPKR